MQGEELGFRRGSPTAFLDGEECLSDKLGLWLRMAQKSFADVVNSDFHRFRVTQLDFLVLSLIANRPGCRQSAIAQQLEIKSPNLASAIDYLVQRGYVSKTADPVDRRANHLTLTDDGVAFVEQLGYRYAEIARGFFRGSEGDHQQRVAVSLLKLIARRPYMAGMPAPTMGWPERNDQPDLQREGVD